MHLLELLTRTHAHTHTHTHTDTLVEADLVVNPETFFGRVEHFRSWVSQKQ